MKLLLINTDEREETFPPVTATQLAISAKYFLKILDRDLRDVKVTIGYNGLTSTAGCVYELHKDNRETLSLLDNAVQFDTGYIRRNFKQHTAINFDKGNYSLTTKIEDNATPWSLSFTYSDTDLNKEELLSMFDLETVLIAAT